jgi:hypothetical protein
MKSPLLVCAGLLTACLPTLLLLQGINLLFVVPLGVGLFVAALGAMEATPRGEYRRTNVGVALCVLAAIGPFLVTAYMNRSGHPIRIVLPDGYQGHVSIIRNPVLGQDVPFENGRWVFRIPANGILRMKDDSAFFQWHTLEMFEVSGQPRKLEGRGISRPSDGEKHDEQEHRYVVLGEFNDNPP